DVSTVNHRDLHSTHFHAQRAPLWALYSLAPWPRSSLVGAILVHPRMFGLCGARFPECILRGERDPLRQHRQRVRVSAGTAAATATCAERQRASPDGTDNKHRTGAAGTRAPSPPLMRSPPPSIRAEAARAVRNTNR